MSSDPADHPRAALLAGAANEAYREIARLRAELDQVRAELAEARERLPEGERWCATCGTYEDDYQCRCARCAACGARLADVTREDAYLEGRELCAACQAQEDAAELAAAQAFLARNRARLRAHQRTRGRG